MIMIMNGCLSYSGKLNAYSCQEQVKCCFLTNSKTVSHTSQADTAARRHYLSYYQTIRLQVDQAMLLLLNAWDQTTNSCMLTYKTKKADIRIKILYRKQTSER